MLSEDTDRRPLRRQGGQVWDPVSQKTFTLVNNKLCIRNLEQQSLAEIKISQLPVRDQKLPSCLKFKRTQNKNLLVGPSGQSVTCKSERLQQCDFNMTYTEGISLWGIFCSGNCLALTVGVRNEETKKQRVLQFTAQSPLKISFKLNLQDHTLSAWVIKAVHETKKNIALPTDVKSWTPFIRVKGLRVNLFLSDMIADPEEQISIFNVFGETKKCDQILLCINQPENLQIEENNSPLELDVLDENTLIIRGDDKIRLLRRFDGQKQFNTEIATMSESKIKIPFTRKQIQILQLVGIKIDGDVNEKNYVGKTLNEWNSWGKNFFSFVDKKSLQKNSIQSKQLYKRVYQIGLRKIETLRFSSNQIKRSCSAFMIQQEITFGVNRSVFPLSKFSFSIPKSLSLNNSPGLCFNQKIKKIASTSHYLIVWLHQIERFIIFNRQSQVLKLGQICLKKGFKKQYEMNQYQKELDELQSVNSSEPSIYKILKNCLKYADKVKPPQKILKKIEENKKKEQKKEDQFEINKSLMNTLLSMGFAPGPSKKALLECKNSSLESAIDLILKKYINEPQETKKTTSGSTQWRCQVCTLINNPTSLACQACTTPKPAQKIEEMKQQNVKVEQEKQQQPQENSKEQDIISENIEGNMVQLYVWQTGFAYAPLILGGLFKDKLRIRLFGPNPKYYSIFYQKDQQFVDLSHFTIHDEAYEIDQKPVRYQYLLGSTPQQLKQAGYGWICLEDQDIALENTINNVQLRSIKTNKKDISFEVSFQNNNKQLKIYDGKIVISNIYQQKRRALTIVPDEKKDKIKVQDELKGIQAQKIDRYYQNSNIIPAHGYLELDLISQNAKNFQNYTSEEVVCEQINQKPSSSSRNYTQLPLYSINSEKSVQMAYPNCPLNPGKRPLTLQHLQNKKFSGNIVMLQKIGKTATNQTHVGYFWFSQNHTKKPLRKYKFQIPKGHKKIYISCPSSNEICSYFSIELIKNDSEDENNLLTIQEIGFVGLLGQAYDEQINLCTETVSTKYFDNQLRIQATDSKDALSKDFKFEINVLNNEIDLSMASESKINQILEQYVKKEIAVDLKIKIFNIAHDNLVLKKLELLGWNIIRQKSVFTQKLKVLMLENDYKQMLKQFISDPSIELLNILLDDKNKDYRSLIATQNCNLTKMFMTIIDSKLQKSIKAKYVEFIRKFSQNLVTAAKAGNLDYKELFNHAVKACENKCSTFGVQIAAQLLKIFPSQQKLLYKNIEQLVPIFEKNKEFFIKKKGSADDYNDEINKFRTQKRQNLIYSRYLMQKGKIYKKYIIDMFNVYDVQEIALNFQKTVKKSAMRVIVRSVNAAKKAKIQLDQMYPQCTIQQLTISNEEQKSSKSSIFSPQTSTLYLHMPNRSINCRYLLIQISFGSSPSNPSLKQIQRMPNCEIVPEIYGSYVGESDVLMDQFKFSMDSLIFVRGEGGFNKYSISQDKWRNSYYYMTEQWQPDQMQKQDDMQKVNKQSNEDKKWIFGVLAIITEQLAVRGGDFQPTEEIISYLLNIVNNLERSVITQRIVQLLKKLCRKGDKVNEYVFKGKISSESLFYQIFRDSPIDIEKICNLLESDTSIDLNNSIWLCKCKSNHPDIKQLTNKILSLSLKNNKIDDIIVLFEKYGWTDQSIVQKIMECIMRKNKNRQFASILRTCKDNKQLSNYITTLLSEEGHYEFFRIGLDELNNENRKLKQEQISPVLNRFIKYIQNKCMQVNNSFDEQELNEDFILLSRNINRFAVKDSQIVDKYIETFTRMGNKRPLLKQFLQIEALKSQKYSERIVQICLTMLEEVLTSRNKINELEEYLSLIYEILIFLFRNQVDFMNSEENTSSPLNNLTQENQTNIITIFCKILTQELNVGGQSNIKIINSEQLLILSISSCLATIISRNLNNSPKTINLSDTIFRQILRWNIVNITTNPQKNNLSSLMNNWSKVESITWEIVSKASDIDLKVLEQQFDYFNSELLKLQNSSIYYKLYQNKLHCTISRLLTQTSNNVEISSKMIKNVVFERMFKKIVSLPTEDIDDALQEDANDEKNVSRGKTTEIVEKQLANSFVLERNSQQQPKDWLLYKNGAKNSVYQFQYPKSTKKSHEIILKFKEKETVNLQKIIVGFEYKTTNDETSCIPSQIIVEAGSDIKQLKFIGKMIPQPDDHFINYSVRVFGLNINHPRMSNVFKSLKKIPQIKFLRLTISCNNKNQLTQALSIATDTKQKILKSSINFLSIQGYHYPSVIPTPQIASLINFISIISDPKYKTIIQQLFKEEKIVNIFNESLANLGLLMRNQKYERILHKFVMRVCEVNYIIGDQTIRKYLTLNNAFLCAKIVAEIILANQVYLGNRLIMLNEFILANLQVLNNKGSINKLEPFLDRFSQIINIIVRQPSKNSFSQKIKIKFTSDSIKNLIKIESKSQIIAKYICILLSLSQQKFEIDSKQISYPQIYQLLKQTSIANTESAKMNRDILHALIISNKNARSWFMNNNELEQLSKNVLSLVNKSNTEDNQNIVKAIENNLNTMSELSANFNIKSLINKNKYNVQIFETFLKQEKLLTKESNNGLRKEFVNFIISTVLNTQNQKIIGEMLKQSLTGNIVESNQMFVGQVFLPILNSYNKLPLCLIPYESTQGRILVDHNSISNPLSNTKKIQSKKDTHSSKFRLPSSILSSTEHKQQFIKQLKNKARINNGQFNLSFNHGSHAIIDNIESLLFNKKQSLLMLFKLNNQTGNSSNKDILGVYHHYDAKNVAGTNNKNWNEKCILFLTKEKSKVLEFIDISGQNGKKMMSLYSEDPDYDDSFIEEKTIQLTYNNQSFAEIMYSLSGDNYDTSYFALNFLKSNQMSQSTVLQSAQYWFLDAASEDTAQSQQISQAQEQSLTSLLLQSSSLTNLSLLTQKFESNSPLRLLRSTPIYEFPSSITLTELKDAIEVMKCRVKSEKAKELKMFSLKPKSDKLELENIDEEAVLSGLMKKNPQEPILDLFLEVDELSNLLNFSSASTKQKPVNYLPKKGILKYFEENNGITSMIKVLKKSIECWNNAARKEKWLQYVLELEKFSSFPHFFGMYLKDSETFELLFKLLSGLPDIQAADKKWDQLQSKSSQKLLKIVSQILEVDKSSEFREYAMQNQFFSTILERLRILTGMYKREYKQVVEKEEETQSPSKQMTEDDGVKQVKKKKGVGYGNDGASNTKWMKGVSEAELKKQFEVIEIILNMIENFLNFRNWKIPKKLLDNVFQSALLPYLEDSLRAGTLLQISKHPTKFRLVFKILKTFSSNSQLVPILIKIPENYQPKQTESIQSLIKSLQNTATIFLACLKQNTDATKNDKASQQLAELIIETAKCMEQAIEEYNETNAADDTQLEEQMKNILQSPIQKQYRALLKDLRFDYMDMKDGSRIKHHYSSSFSQNYTPNQTKMIRLAQELADISTALPYEHTNAVFVRCDKDRVDFMQALIMGSNGTPYGHGAFLFDVYFDDNYPNGPPKVNLTTTGHGKIRFNPNLYACGKVCLSLLGTWRGSASENWDAKVSTLLQVLLSIQAIIMSEEVYFNEPGFENQQGTAQGEKKNQAYSNIVRYGNIKFAMIQNIRTPPKGFQTVIRRHFYVKRDQIMQECKKWLLYAEKRPANYIGLVNDHNNSWSTEFKKSKTQYKQMLQKAIGQLEQEFKKLQPPSIHDITAKSAQKKKKKTIKKDGESLNLLKKLQEEGHQQIDVTYEQAKQSKEIDINDQKVKDRWSRYIGAMGVDAVSRQSKADILIFGIGPMSLEVVKNIVLSGCRKLTLCDDLQVSQEDLSGGFFYNEQDIGKKRIETALHKIKELNIYVKIDTITKQKATADFIKNYHIVLVTEMPFAEQFTMNEACRKNNVKFISADCKGAYCRLLNDLGEKFEVLDKNGEQPVEVIIKSITEDETATVTLLDGLKHPYEDNQAILIKDVEGMANKQDPSKSINGTIHKIKVINSKSFTIGDTRGYAPYIRNGTAKNIKTPIFLKHKSMKEVFDEASQKLPLDENMQFYDFVKMSRNKTIHNCFVALDEFIKENKSKPKPWNIQDANKFFTIFSKLTKEDIDASITQYVKKFSFTCSGYLPPLAAYFGGFVSQEIIKSITQKFKPTDSVFYMDAEQIIPELPEDEKKMQEEIKKIYTGESKRLKGLQIVVGKDLLELIKNSKLFMIGAGAIGCELLKNFAMVGLGTGEKGKITLTDPDHIENSNLNRQFLFREKHISKPKSRTAAASILLMNPQLKGHVSALLERVSDKTKDIFSNGFFESLTFVANALDNVAARRYVDQRCVQNKIPLFQSGTLGPKGHTQVILPYKTESYGSQNDPVQDGQIPHCTLKMFPEQTLHCVEWARDIFGKKFSLQPKAFQKIKDKTYKPEKDDIKSLNECLTMATKGPRSFDDCIAYAIMKFYKYFRDDIIQLLYTYPLDAKTKNGEPFWKLPKRPPTPVKYFDQSNLLHCIFISSMAVLIAKIYKIPYPKNFREQKERRSIAKQASKIKIPEFVPSDQKSKQILKESAADEAKKEGEGQEKMMEEEGETDIKVSDQNQMELYEQVMKNGADIDVVPDQFEKDDDQNGHIDFIYSMANLRALNYKLEQMDWITTKLKAGRIVPALATTTTCVAGLQTLQICKYLKNLKLDKMRNSFLNLAVPSLQMSEPGQVLKVKLTQNLEVNLWDRWQVPCKQNTTFGEVYKFLSQKYSLCPIGVLQGMSRIDTSKSEADKKKFLNEKVLDKLDREENYIDIVVLFTKTEGEGDMLKNVPPVRLTFSK